MSNNIENLSYWMNWLDSTTDVIFIKDLEGIYRGVSKSTAIIAGFNSVEEMIGKTDFEIYPPDSARDFSEQDKQVILTEKPNLVEDWLKHPRKGLIKIETLKAPLYDENGTLIGVQGISRDITDKYNYEQTICHQQSQIDAIVENIPFPIWLKDANGKYLSVNKSYESFFGLTKNEVLGLKPLDILKQHKLFSQEDSKKLQEEDEKILKEKVTTHSINKMNVNGQDYYLEMTKSPVLGSDGEILGIAGISRDITEKYNYEQTIINQQSQINAIVENIPFPIWLKDVQGRYLLLNKSYEKFYGIKKEDVIGLNPLEVLSDGNVFSTEDAKKLADEDEKILREKIIINVTNKMTINGNDYFLEITKCPILDNNGEVIGIAGISVDVTAHKLYEDELNNARALAEEANRTKSDFLANMSHEIRTPMNGIMGFIQLLAETSLDDEQKDFVEEAKKSSEILLKLLNDVLDLSKIEAGKMTMERISFSIRYVVEDVATLASSNVARKNIEINAFCHSSVPERVFGDPTRLKQVLNNFVNNAIKFTESGEISISVKMLEKQDSKVKLFFTVQDTGIGIPKEKQSSIFESFTQADSSTTRKYGGTGLGLTISKNIIYMMNGEISVKSKENEGSTFGFTAEFETDNSEASFKTSASDLKGLKILVVDDNRTNLKVISHYLKEYGVKTFEELKSTAALEFLRNENNEIDLILTDYCMPEIDGIELVREIHKIEKYKDVPIVLLTSRAQRGDYNMAKENRLRGYLPKPIRKNELIECITMLSSEGKNGINAEKPLITRHIIKEKRMREDVKILLVEDSQMNQKLAIKMLNKAGYYCDVAQNGQEAVSAIIDGNYNMVFMDCQMPIMDGYEATKKIREFEIEKKLKFTPIIALTANAMHSDINDCMQAGMDDYLAKPINYEDFIGKIKKYSISDDEKKSENIEEAEMIMPEEGIIENSYKESITKAILADLGIEKDDAEELLADFLVDFKNSLFEMETALQNNESETLAQVAHSVKGASGNLRINNVYNESSQIEQLAKNGILEEIPNLIDHLKFELEELSR